MIHLIDNQENRFKIISEGAIKSCVHTRELKKEGHVSDYLSVELRALDDDTINELEYIALPTMGDERGVFYLFYVASIKTENSTTYIEAVSAGVEELRKSVIEDRRLYDNTARDMLSVVVEGTNWELGYVPSTPKRRTNFYYISAFEALQKVLEVHEIECEFVVEISGNKIAKRRLEVRNMIGDDTGRRVVYGHNALKVVHEVARTDIVTALIGRGKGEEIEAPEETSHGRGTYGRRIQFKDVEWSVAKGDPTDKPLGQNYIENKEATAKYGIKTPNGNRPKIAVVEFQQEDDPTRLLEKTYAKLQELSRPQVLFETSSVYLPAEVGDRVRVVRPDRGLDYKVRVIRVDINRLNPKASNLRLGDRIESGTDRLMSRVVSMISDSEEKQAGRVEELVDWAISADGHNINWYSDADPFVKYPGRVGIGDLWFAPDPEYEGEIIMYTWNGEFWEELVRTKNWNDVKAAVEEAEKAVQNMNATIEANNRRADEIEKQHAESMTKFDSEITKVRKQIDESNRSLKNVEHNIDGVSTKFDSEITEVRKQIDESNRSLKNVEHNIDGVSTKFANDLKGTESRFTQIANALDSTIKDTKSNLESRITQVAGGLRGDFTQSLKSSDDKIYKKIGEVEYNIDGVSTKFANDLKGAESRFTQKANALDSTIKDTKSNLESRITQVANGLRSDVSDLEGGLNSKITQLSNRIESTITDTKNSTLSSAKQTAEALINEVRKEQDWKARVATGTSLMGEDVTFQEGLNGLVIYDNSKKGNIKMSAHWRYVNKTVRPPTGEYTFVKLIHSGEASPGHGGVCKRIDGELGHEYIVDFTAELPKGYTFGVGNNALGEGGYVEWLTDNKGTGDWERYAYKVRFGNKASDPAPGGHNFNYTYVKGGDSNNFEWRLCRYDVVDVSDSMTLRSTVRQLNDSWVMQLKTGGDIVTEINASTDGIRLRGKTIHLDGNTKIDNGVINNAHISNLNASKITSGTLNAARVNVVNINANNITANKTNFIQSGWNGINSNVSITGNGLTIYHNDGSYTRANAHGLKTFVGGVGYTTHYLKDVFRVNGVKNDGETNPTKHSGIYSNEQYANHFGVWPWFYTYQLPAVYKGKRFKVSASIANTQTYHSSYYRSNQMILQRVVCYVEQSRINYSNATVPIVAYAHVVEPGHPERFWNYPVDVVLHVTY